MKSGGIRWFFGFLGVLFLTIRGIAQQPPDPRVGLKPGLRDAGQAEIGRASCRERV